MSTKRRQYVAETNGQASEAHDDSSVTSQTPAQVEPPPTKFTYRYTCRATLKLIIAICLALVSIALPLSRYTGGRFLAPALTPSTLPPGFVFWPFISLVAALDALARMLTPPNMYLFRSTMSHLHTAQIHAAAQLRVADELYRLSGGDIDAAVPAATLARAIAPQCAAAAAATVEADGSCEAVAARLSRLLRALSSYGIFAEAAPAGCDAWRNTAASDYLREASPHSLRAVALTFGGPQFRMMEHLGDAVVSGRSAFAAAHGGAGLWAWYDAQPQQRAVFDATMVQLGNLGGADGAIASDVPWRALAGAGLVDVGGGYGHLLRRIIVTGLGRDNEPDRISASATGAAAVGVPGARHLRWPAFVVDLPLTVAEGMREQHIAESRGIIAEVRRQEQRMASHPWRAEMGRLPLHDDKLPYMAEIAGDDAAENDGRDNGSAGVADANAAAAVRAPAPLAPKSGSDKPEGRGRLLPLTFVAGDFFDAATLPSLASDAWLKRALAGAAAAVAKLGHGAAVPALRFCSHEGLVLDSSAGSRKGASSSDSGSGSDSSSNDAAFAAAIAAVQASKLTTHHVRLIVAGEAASQQSVADASMAVALEPSTPSADAAGKAAAQVPQVPAPAMPLPIFLGAAEGDDSAGSSFSISSSISSVANGISRLAGLGSSGSVGNSSAAGSGSPLEAGVAFMLRDVLHDWADQPSAAILRSLRAALRTQPASQQRCAFAAGGSGAPASSPASGDGDGAGGLQVAVATIPAAAAGSAEDVVPRDRVLLVDRLVRPGAGFVESFGTADADTVMLAAFGTTAGERTQAQFAALLARAGLQLERVWPTRSHYVVIEASAVQ